MLKASLITFLTLFICSISLAQQYSQSGVIHTDMQLYTKNGIQINGTSKEMHIEYPVQDQKMEVTIDPHTIKTDNIEFDQQLYDCILEDFVFVAELDASSLEYHSNYNETIELQTRATINNVTQNVMLYLIISNKKTTNRNVMEISGKGRISISDFKLDEIFPNLEGELIVRFTQKLIITY